VQRHGIGRPLHPSQLGSTPHDDITIPQIRSSHSLPLNRPRQSASRHPPVVTNRPTTYRVRCDPPLIQQPFHHPPACWSASTPFTHLIRGAQIPIAQAATPTSPSLGFLPWRFAYAGPRCTPRHRHGAAIRKPSQKRHFDRGPATSGVPPETDIIPLTPDARPRRESIGIDRPPAARHTSREDEPIRLADSGRKK
jgi:hypothetical protein